MLNYILVGVDSVACGISRYWASGLIVNRFGHLLVMLGKARVIDYRADEETAIGAPKPQS
ncbi:MAG: hypothetical protein ACLPYZ_11060 [Limisphaerales bacterium]